MKREYTEEEYLLLSGIQHFEFCRRQWALIHIEGQWAENTRTIEGEHLHERAHDTLLNEKRGDIITSRGMSVFSKVLGVSGVCDIVEFHKDPQGIEIFGREGKYLPIPIEYKRGNPKDGDEDIVQLVAQAICLEEMLLCKIDMGYLFYGETRHRICVTITPELKTKVIEMCTEMHSLYEKLYTPKVKINKRCNACSLKEICMPKLCNNLSVSSYIERNMQE